MEGFTLWIGSVWDSVGWPHQLLLPGCRPKLNLRAEPRPQSGSRLKGSWLKRNVQWAASAQEGLKKAWPSPGLCVRVISCSSQLISLAGLWHFWKALFPWPLWVSTSWQEGVSLPVPEVEATRCVRCWGKGRGRGLVAPNLVTMHSCQLYPAGVSSFYSQQQLLSLSPSPSLGAPAQDKRGRRRPRLPSHLHGAPRLLIPS